MHWYKEEHGWSPKRHIGQKKLVERERREGERKRVERRGRACCVKVGLVWCGGEWWQ